MRPQARPRIALAFLLTLAAGCVSKDNPLRYPSVLKVQTQGGGRAWAVDLDGDHVDENLLLRNAAPPFPGRGPTQSLLFGNISNAFEQTNYWGDLLTPHFLDVVGDSLPEVVVPLIRNDSLFLSVASGEGKKLFGFLLATGKPRVEPDGVLPWDPAISGMWAMDVNQDGQKELVTWVNTRYARRPRGVFVNALPGGELIGKLLLGAPPYSVLLDDSDGDGRPEILAGTQNTKQGVDDGGFSDEQTYVIRVDLSPTPHVTWSERLEGGDTPVLGWTDIDGDGRRELILAWTGNSLTTEVLDPQTFRVLRRRSVSGRFYAPVLVDLDRDLQPEILSSSPVEPTLLVISSDLESVRRPRLPFDVRPRRTWPDLDGDGIDELEVGVSGRFALLTPDLEIKALYPDSASITAVEHRGADVERRLFLEDRGVGTLAVLRRNPWFPFVRYGPGLLLILVPVGTVLLVGYMRRLHYHLRIVHAAGMERLEAGGHGLMVLDDRGRVRWRGPGLAESVRAGRRSASSLRELAALQPALANWCQEVARERPARRRTSTIALEGADAPRQAAVSMSPVVIGSSHDPHWILRLDESGGATERAWPMMAQRIAHAVKNPLTHMLLTVQRLQVEYRERAPAVASRLDPYADRIQDGIGQLRRLTSSFLKLVDLAEPELEETDVEQMVNDLAEQFRAQLPHDIQLHVEIGERPPKVRLDREQVQVALDNLCTNAVNALESGGTITLSVGTVRGVRLGGASVPEDYVQIEVMDTGKGIAADAGDSIFEPGYTTAEDGSGLGLAIVRKIVADHRGRISFESEKGVGTAFTVHLPVSGPAPAGEERA